MTILLSHTGFVGRKRTACFLEVALSPAISGGQHANTHCCSLPGPLREVSMAAPDIRSPLVRPLRLLSASFASPTGSLCKKQQPLMSSCVLQSPPCRLRMCSSPLASTIGEKKGASRCSPHRGCWFWWFPPVPLWRVGPPPGSGGLPQMSPQWAYPMLTMGRAPWRGGAGFTKPWLG